jgi:uncharacterized repeat protein (TIGR01451 family)
VSKDRTGNANCFLNDMATQQWSKGNLTSHQCKNPPPNAPASDGKRSTTRSRPTALRLDLLAGVGDDSTTRSEISASRKGNQSSHVPRGFNPIDGALLKLIPVRNPESGDVQPAGIWDKAKLFRNLIGAGLVAGLLLAGFNLNAQATNFTDSATGPDLTLTEIHTGDFAQGDMADNYIITVANVGSLPSSGTITVADTLPPGFTVTDVSGTGWDVYLNSFYFYCSRSDALPAGASYPSITVTIAVPINAPATVINGATVSGGGDINMSNNAASDTATVLSNGSTTGATLFGWDVHGLSGGANNFGISPLPSTTNAPNLTVTGLTRGSGVSTNGTAAERAWGAVGFTGSTATNAIAANQFITFGATANSGYTVSYTSISRFDYRRSGAGPTNGLLQYQIGSGAFINTIALSYPTNTSGGASLNPINLSGIVALQNVGAGTNVTFRIVNYDGDSAGAWYIFDVANSTALDLEIQGTVTQTPPMAPLLSLPAFTNHQFQFMVNGMAGSNYVVQASTNLTAPNWISLKTNTALFLFSESNSYPQRFYRAELLP